MTAAGFPLDVLREALDELNASAAAMEKTVWSSYAEAQRLAAIEGHAALAEVEQLVEALRGFVQFCETLAAEEDNPIFALYEQGRAALARFDRKPAQETKL